jgi:hypothetical protein
VLERLASGDAFRAAISAPPDDEPVTAGDAEAIARAGRDLQAGMVVSHDQILREFGIPMKFVWPKSVGAELRGADWESAMRILAALTHYGESGVGDVKVLSGE